jgi:hypothetical protein
MKQPATKARPARKRGVNRAPVPAYLALIDTFPLRPLRSERDYDAAVTVLDTLAVRPEDSLDPGEQDYLDTFGVAANPSAPDRGRLAQLARAHARHA